jgi:hypothetical protein
LINPHLLVSVYICPEGLGQQKYELGACRDASDQFFRISRYFTALHSLTLLKWESVTIYLETDACWAHLKQDIIDKTYLIHPSATILPYRLALASQWKDASEAYDSDAIIYLHSNDDHAFVSEGIRDFQNLVNVMHANSDIKLGAVTHHPEMLGLLFRNRTLKRRGANTVQIGYAIGTTLVRGSFFRSWWGQANFEDQEKIVRPDNPFGKSVTFEQVKMLIPMKEQIRHLDGYSHLGLFLPLTPIRNSLTYRSIDDQYVLTEDLWKYGYWPSKLFASNGRGCDFHITATREHDSLWDHVRIGVARIQASCALRISLTRLICMLRSPNDPIRVMAVMPAVVLGLLSPCVLRNWFNYFLDFPSLLILRTFGLFSQWPKSIAASIWYKGLSRTWKFRSQKN